jgi:glycosyltransferase involved in cell wall biosynthesis
VRVLTITSSYPKFANDTTAPFIESISRELAELGHEVTMVMPARHDLSPVPVERVRFVPYRYAPMRALSVFGYAEGLREDTAVRSTSYAAAPFAITSGAWALLRESARTKFDVLHAHWVVPNGFMALAAQRMRSLPLVVSLHGSDVFLSERNRGFRWAARRTFAHTAAVTACSEDLAERSLHLGAKENPVVIPYGVDTERFRPISEQRRAETRAGLGLPAEATMVLAVGRLVRKKGFEFLVDAVARLAANDRPVTLVLAGKGDLEGELIQRAREGGVESQVRLIGNVERDELPGLFAAADVVAVPSVRDQAGNVDGLPNVLLEAMASGAPIVATRVAGIPDAVREDRDGILVPEKDPAALSAAVDRLRQSRELSKALGGSARRRAEHAFGWKSVGERYDRVLRSVARARST